MKKSFTLILMLLAVFALCSTAKAADYTGYTEFDKTTGVLTFKATSGTVSSSSGIIVVYKFGTSKLPTQATCFISAKILKHYRLLKA